jgi:hypothetical protein
VAIAGIESNKMMLHEQVEIQTQTLCSFQNKPFFVVARKKRRWQTFPEKRVRVCLLPFCALLSELCDNSSGGRKARVPLLIIPQ